MSFIDTNILLVLEKNGQVCLISNRILQKQPILTVSVNTAAEQGLLGIATLCGKGDDDNNSSGGGKLKHNTSKGKITTSEIANKKTTAKQQTPQIQKYSFTLQNPNLVSISSN